MGRIVIKLGQGDGSEEQSLGDGKTRYAQAGPPVPGREGGLARLGDALEFDALRRFYFQPALLIVDLETLEAQCVVVPPGGTLGVGRGNDCQVTIQSDRVSRNHCEIRQRGRAAPSIRDLNSTNGTFVNNLPIEPGKDVPLRAGDVAVLGSSFVIRTFPLGSSPAHAGDSFLFPLWVFLGQAQAEGSHFLRCCHLVSAFEHLARLIAFADLSTAPPSQSVQPLLGKSKLSMGEWVQAARGALTRDFSQPENAAGAVRHLLEGEEGRTENPKPILENLNFAVRWRNENVGHGAPQADAAYRRPHAELAGRLRELMETFPAFHEALVVSAAGCRVDPDGSYRTQVTVHDPVWGMRRPITARRPAPLMPGTYLVLSGTEALVSLGRYLRMAGCPACGGTELFVADGLAPTAPFTSPATNHKADPDELVADGE